MKTMRTLSAGLACLGMLTAGACQDTVVATPSSSAPTNPSTAPAVSDQLSAESTLRLTVVERTAESVGVDLHYAPTEEMAKPRNVELWLKHSDALTYRSVEPLAAVQDAGKTLLVQPREAGELRTIIYSTSLTRLQAGPVARLTFDATGAGPATVQVLERLPIFAPAEANQGISLPDPLVVPAG